MLSVLSGQPRFYHAAKRSLLAFWSTLAKLRLKFYAFQLVEKSGDFFLKNWVIWRIVLLEFDWILVSKFSKHKPWVLEDA